MKILMCLDYTGLLGLIPDSMLVCIGPHEILALVDSEHLNMSRTTQEKANRTYAYP